MYLILPHRNCNAKNEKQFYAFRVANIDSDCHIEQWRLLGFSHVARSYTARCKVLHKIKLRLLAELT